MKNIDKKFSFIQRAKSFNFAGRGIYLFIKTTHNAWIHIAAGLTAIFCGFYFDIDRIDWILLIIITGFVLVAEAFNTAIEIDIDLTSPEYHPYARDTKDVAAGAVLISAIVALIVGILIFSKYIF
jgi:diacylglycerol kinase (ATP)